MDKDILQKGLGNQMRSIFVLQHVQSDGMFAPANTMHSDATRERIL